MGSENWKQPTTDRIVGLPVANPLSLELGRKGTTFRCGVLLSGHKIVFLSHLSNRRYKGRTSSINPLL